MSTLRELLVCLETDARRPGFTAEDRATLEGIVCVVREAVKARRLEKKRGAAYVVLTGGLDALRAAVDLLPEGLVE